MASKRQPKTVPTRVRKTVLASEIEPEAIRYIADDVLPGRFARGKLNLIAGRPGQGKSLVSILLASLVTQRGAAVVLSAPEDGKADVQVPRLLAAGADLRLVHFWPGVCWLPENTEELEFLIEKQGVEVVILDPIRKHLSRRDVNLALQPLIDVAERTGAAIIGIHHLLKKVAPNAHPQEAIGGEAGGLLGTARVCFAFGPVAGRDEDVRVMAPVKANSASMDTSVEFLMDVVEFDLPNGEVHEVPRLVLTDPDSSVKGGAVVGYNGGGSGNGEGNVKLMSVAADWLVFRLLHGPVSAKTLENECGQIGVSWRTVNRALKEMKPAIVKKRVGFGKGSHFEWSLPDDHPALVHAGYVPANGPLPLNLGGDDEDGMDEFDKAVAALLGGEDDV